jgi:formylglycine-generating enzyme required for sulfatase activity/predicted Ser/Thr protein kinase
MASSNSLVGKTLGSYQVQREIGRGGMGVVYLAHEQSLGRVVAVKVLASRLADDAAYVKRFGREARAVARLDHPNIVHALSVGEQDGLYYIAMQYVKGRSLAQFIREKSPLEWRGALDITRQAAEALAEAHKHGIIHRDIKPDNIMVDETGRVKVMDFGLARATAASTKLTADGTQLGTPMYMSPEQINGNPVDGRTDIYSLGVTLYEMLTGRPPFQADTPMALMYQITHKPLPDVSKQNAAVPDNVVELVAGMTAQDPGRRYPSAQALRSRLIDVLSGSSRVPERQIVPQAAMALDAQLRSDILELSTGLTASRSTHAVSSQAPASAQDEPSTRVTIGRRSVLAMLVVLFVLLGVSLWPRGNGGGIAEAPVPAETPATEPPAESSDIGELTWRTKGEGAVLTLPGGVTVEMVWIPPGTFMMGSPPGEEGRADDEKQRKVTISKGFWMGKYEVTQAQWKAVMGSNPSDFKGDNLPVENVSWNDCQEFIKRLNARREGRFRLPTEAEWEYACRAGTTTPYHFGRTISTDQANYSGISDVTGKRVYRKQTTDVGSFEANAWGLCDMHGNVWEWCQDWFGDYSGSTVTDPTGATSGTARVLRGAGWGYGPLTCRSAYRGSGPPDNRSWDDGFRVVVVPENSSWLVDKDSR